MFAFFPFGKLFFHTKREEKLKKHFVIIIVLTFNCLSIFSNIILNFFMVLKSIIVNLKNVRPQICKTFSRPNFLGFSTLEKFKITLEQPVHFIMKINFYKSLMARIPRFLNIFFSAFDIMEAVRGRFSFYGMNYIYLTTTPVVV